MTLGVVLMLLQAAAAAAPEREIVVTARPLAETEKSLRDCLARNCPPDQEVAAALAHAENQFVGGEYQAAKITLGRTRARVRRHARAYPVAVGDLLRARGRVMAHLGDQDPYRMSMIESLDALRKGLGPDDPRVLAQRLEIGDVFAGLGRTRMALDMYEGVEGRARDLRLPVLQGHAMLRRAMMYAATAEIEPLASNHDRAQRAIRRLQDTPGPELQPFRDVAAFLEARLEATRGDERVLDRLIAQRRIAPGLKPALIWAPPLDANSVTAQPIRMSSGSGSLGTGGFEDQWFDLGYWIRPDGTVTDAHVLRGSKRLDRTWTGPVIKMIARRRYAPLSLPSDHPGLLRIERVTRTSWYDTRGRFKVRSGVPELQFLDLTEDPAPTP